MKKLIAIISVIAMVFSMSGSAFADFYADFYSDPRDIITKTATAAISGTGTRVLGLSVTLKNVGTDTAPADQDNIAWTVDRSVTALDWQVANQYLEVGGFETFPQWGIQIYTENKTAADLTSGKYTGTGNPAGLVNTSTGTSTVPVCYRIAVNSSIRDGRFATGTVDLKMAEKYIATGPRAGDTVIVRTLTEDVDPTTPGVQTDFIDDTHYFAPWYWMLDKGLDLDPDLAGNQTQYGAYCAFVDSGSFRTTPVDSFPIPKKDAKYCVYLGAKFTAAAAGVTYKTTKLTVQMYHL